MSFELIVFDWDGTLMDSEAHIVDCMQRAFVELGLEPPPREAAREIIGLSLERGTRELLPGAEPEIYEALILAYRRRFLGATPNASALFAGAVEVLSTLTERGCRLAVATGKSRAGLDKSLRETGLSGFFHATRCADETFSKPHPQMLFELMDELGATAEETLMIGDTEFDMQMARNAGVAGLAVSYGVHAPERLLAHQPLACIDRLSAIPGWLAARTTSEN
ncbi:HAD-IA family hydrolase [Marichromatium bheemlicum]|uniref:HAD-IA family hydrolase n=1 Tax=Marichromatium bheemlicum TaxID=365339 RepID=A0ABX1I3H5_9GAMM|nr:HAD-IA family hydrolase [Marichromatium bheemlicum]